MKKADIESILESNIYIFKENLKIMSGFIIDKTYTNILKAEHMNVLITEEMNKGDFEAIKEVDEENSNAETSSLFIKSADPDCDDSTKNELINEEVEPRLIKKGSDDQIERKKLTDREKNVKQHQTVHTLHKNKQSKSSDRFEPSYKERILRSKQKQNFSHIKKYMHPMVFPVYNLNKQQQSGKQNKPTKKYNKFSFFKSNDKNKKKELSTRQTTFQKQKKEYALNKSVSALSQGNRRSHKNRPSNTDSNSIKRNKSVHEDKDTIEQRTRSIPERNYASHGV